MRLENRAVFLLLSLVPILVVAEPEDIPELGATHTVYLGDKMVEQRVGFYDRCLTATKRVVLTRTRFERNCLKSSKLFQEKYSGGISQITEGAILCPLPAYDKKGKRAFVGMNFDGYQRKDGTDNRPARPWTLRENKTKKRWHAEPNGTKVVDLTTEEFDKTFTEQKVFNAEFLSVPAGYSSCESSGPGYASYTLARNVTEPLSDVPSGPNVQISLGLNDFVSGSDDRASISSDVFARAYNSWASANSQPYNVYRGYPVNARYNPDDLDRQDNDGEISVLVPRSMAKFSDLFKVSNKYRIIEDQLQRNVEYAGKSGNVLSFVYSEFYGGFARDAFTREFKIDLSEGNVGAYKGAVFEVIEATNATITYKVIRHFPPAALL